MPDELCLPAPLALRTARAEDDGFQQALYRSTRDDLLRMAADPAMIEPLLTMQYRAQVAGYRATYPEACYWIVEHQGNPIGRVVLDIGVEALRLVDIAFVPAARGQGHGTRLIQALQGLNRPLALSVYRENGGARRLYAALGFQPVGSDAMLEHMLWRSTGMAALQE